MIAILGTLPFLATLWLLMVLGAAILEDSGAKIVAALKGKTVEQPMMASRAIRMRDRKGAQPVRRVSEAWRAAA